MKSAWRGLASTGVTPTLYDPPRLADEPSASALPRKSGVRRGRSACTVGSRAPDCAMLLFDMWLQNYAEWRIPGPDLVKSELAKVFPSGSIEFVKRRFRTRPSRNIFAITPTLPSTSSRWTRSTQPWAAQDLADVMPRLKIGGAIVFDDICHPKHPGLRDVWRRLWKRIAAIPSIASARLDTCGVCHTQILKRVGYPVPRRPGNAFRKSDLP